MKGGQKPEQGGLGVVDFRGSIGHMMSSPTDLFQSHPSVWDVSKESVEKRGGTHSTSCGQRQLRWRTSSSGRRPNGKGMTKRKSYTELNGKNEHGTRVTWAVRLVFLYSTKPAVFRVHLYIPATTVAGPAGPQFRSPNLGSRMVFREHAALDEA